MRKYNVTVVIPCYNSEATIGETLSSVFGQRGCNLEVIVVDDGSTDRTPKIVAGFSKKIQLVRCPNQGVSTARNIGTALSSGCFLQYVDSDDLLADDAIAERVAALEANRCDVAYSDWQRFSVSDGGGKHYGRKIERSIEDISSDYEVACATAFWAPPVALMYRAQIVAQIGGWRTDLPVIQDARFLFDAARHGARFVRVKRIGAFYREPNGKSLSSMNVRRFVLDVFRNCCSIHDLWEGFETFSDGRRAALCQIYEYTAREFFNLAMPEFFEATRKLRSLRNDCLPFSLNICDTVARFVGLSNARRLAFTIRRAKTIRA